jgi:hypothetical protein
LLAVVGGSGRWWKRAGVTRLSDILAGVPWSQKRQMPRGKWRAAILKAEQNRPKLRVVGGD